MNSNEMASIEMPKYQCHKQAWALKIKDIHVKEFLKDPSNRNKPEDIITITPEEARYAPFEVSAAYYEKHKPQIGGYYVLYTGAYQSYSPAKEFEDGYTLIK